MLFDKFKFKSGLELKNRIVMPPMCIDAAKDGIVNDTHIAHYGIRSILGVGMVIVEATAVTPNGRIEPEDLGIWSDEHIEGLKRIVNILKDYGTVPAIQIAHAGRKGFDDLVAPSAIAFSDKYGVPKELTVSEIKDIIRAFKDAALRAEKAGFEAVEIHGAHGYLINQFLSPLTNKRDDEYGGNSENRFRLLKEIILNIKEVYKGTLFVRVSADEYADGGLHIDDHVKYAKELEKLGIDFLDVSSGGVVPMKYGSFANYQVPLSNELKKNLSIPVGAVGLIKEAIQADEILKNNEADLIMIGRELLKNPMWIKNAADELDESINLPYPYSRIFK